SGRLGDIYGPRNLFAVGVVVFTVASAFSGLAQNSAELILSRGLQGVGAAILAPQGLPIMLSIFPAERRSAVFAIYGVLAGVAVLAGPTLGGWLVTSFGWRWIFYVNLPFGVLTLILARLWVPDLRVGSRHRLDWLGVLLVTGGLLGVVFGLIEGERYSWGQVAGFVSIPLVIAGGIALLALFLVQQARRQGADPLVPFGVFADRNFTLMALVLCAMGFAILGVFLPLTIFLQSVLGLSAVAAGLTVAPQPISMIVTSGIAASLSQKVSGKWLLIPGLTLFAAGIGYIAWAAHADASRWTFLPGLIVSGLGLGFVWTPVFSLATRDLRPELGGVASGLINTIQELGTVIASAAVGALLQNRLAAALHQQALHYSASLPGPVRSQFVSGFFGAAKQGFEVGAGQTGTAVGLPPGLPPGVVAHIHAAAAAVFTH
ncbi:MAG TPA: MFS transporter, partial [Ktedonobacterales bacterium]|nr:MFS transporter [Ktedonobacterales bacterium]